MLYGDFCCKVFLGSVSRFKDKKGKTNGFVLRLRSATGKSITAILRNQRFGHCFLGNLLFFFSGIPPCCSGGCFNLLRGLFFSAHGIPPRNSAHLFSFASRIYFNSCTPPADRLLFLHIKCFLLSQVSCCLCTPGAPPIAELQGIAKQRMSNVQNEKAFRHHRTTADRKASNIQCADQNGDTPLPSNNSLQEQQYPMRRLKWRSAPTGQQKSAKRVMSNVQTKMAFRPPPTNNILYKKI